ncbi:MAG: ferritin-like domain-containing protein [Candidatus Omnitrophota bacterium]
MRKTCLLVAVLMLLSADCFAEIEKDAFRHLNKSLELMQKSVKQYSVHQRQFNAQMPYVQIIPERKRQANELAELITFLGGTPLGINIKNVSIAEVNSIHEALLSDAALEMRLIEVYNFLLYKYEDEQMQKVIEFFKGQAIIYFMMFDNISQFSILGMLESVGKGGGRPSQEMPRPKEDQMMPELPEPAME